MTRHEPFRPADVMLRESVLGIAHRSTREQVNVLATALLDAHGRERGAQIASQLSGALLDIDSGRRANARVRACREPVQTAPSARPVALADLSRPTDPPMWRAVAVGLLLVCALTVVAVLAAAGAATISNTAAQIERGAVEW